MYRMVWPEAMDVFYDMLQGRKWRWVAFERWPHAYDDKMQYRYSIICEPKNLLLMRHGYDNHSWYYPDPFRHVYLEEGEFERNKVQGVSYVFPPED